MHDLDKQLLQMYEFDFLGSNSACRLEEFTRKAKCVHCISVVSSECQQGGRKRDNLGSVADGNPKSLIVT